MIKNALICLTGKTDPLSREDFSLSLTGRVLRSYPDSTPNYSSPVLTSSTMTKSSSHPSRLGTGGACTVDGLPPSSLSDELS